MESVPKKRKIEGRCSRQPIPDELISEVLVRLPVKSLLRFRCVSRTWRSLISDPHLIESHHRRSQQHPLALVREWNLNGDNKGKATYVPTRGATLQRIYYDVAGFNSISDMAVRVFSSSPDLICIREDGSRCSLLNPATRERVTLPEFSSGNTTFLRYVGFGYVPSLRKFKVARVFGHVDIDRGSGRQVVEERCAVLTVGVDRSWRPARGPPFMITRDQMAFVNGALHMTPSTEEGKGLAALDLETEAWRVIPMPRGCIL
ncbi:putative F-box protein At3g52320 [Ananas comosus]|uniref:F-box protein At3g52320 n=1 Tax=Ananas comosus TaxID=4615 RepID=A0A6P5GDU6_ANACO|nr:putative F-box protein At3g52320 [Ananas comosus]